MAAASKDKRLEVLYGYKGAILTFLATLLGVIGTLLASVFLSYAGWWKDSRDVDLKMIDIALAILAGEKGDGKAEQPIAARRFAIETLKMRSGVNMSPEDWESWINSRVPLVYYGSPPGYTSPRPITEEDRKNFESRTQSIRKVFGSWALDSEPNCIIKFGPAVFLELDHVSSGSHCKIDEIRNSTQFDSNMNGGKIRLYDSAGDIQIELGVAREGVLGGNTRKGQKIELKKIDE